MSSTQRGPYWEHVDPLSAKFQREKWPFYQMARLVGLYHLRLDAVLKPIGMDVSRWRVLSILSLHGPATVTKLSEEAVTKISTMAKIVQRMAAQDLVSTQASTEDARSTMVSLADPGRDVLEKLRVKVGIIFVQAFHNVTEEELQQINAISAKIYQNLL